MTEGRTYGGESAADRGARRRRQLLDAGLELFGTQGFRAATVRGICREARVADRNFYEEFATTEELLLAIYDECTDRLQTAAAEAIAEVVAEVVAEVGDGDLVAVAGAGIGAFLRVIADDPRVGRLVWLEMVGVSPRVTAAYLGRMELFGAFLLGLLPDLSLSTAEVADPAEVPIILRAAVGGVSHVVLSWLMDDMTQPREEVAAALMRYLVGVASVARTS